MIAAALREQVFEASRALARTDLVLGTFGNVSAIDRAEGIVVIKPSGVGYDALTPAHMVPVSLESGDVIEGSLRPSSDTPTHLELYRAFSCGGIVHTHSAWATTLAQAGLPVRCMGTTHADYFRGDVPVTRSLREQEVATDYERNTGLLIVETFREGHIDPEQIPAVLVANHGPFTWGVDPFDALERAEVLEFLSRMDVASRAIAPEARPPATFLVDKHFFRKHGATAYYGQRR